MRGIAQIVPPSAIQRRLDHIRARHAPAAIVEAKLHAKAGQYREALVLLIEAGGAEPEHLAGYDRWVAEQPPKLSAGNAARAIACPPSHSLIEDLV